MAFPSPLAENTGVESGNTTSHVIQIPAHSTGDRLRFAVAFDGNPGIVSVGAINGAAWNERINTSSGGACKLAVYDTTAVANQATPTTVTLTTDASEQSVHRTTVWASNVEFAYSAAATGTSTGPNPPNLTTGWGASQDTRWVAVCGYDFSRTVTAYPTNYTTGQFNDVSGGGAGCGLGTASRDLTAASDDPAAFTIDSSDQWVAVTIAARLGAATSQANYRIRSDDTQTVNADAGWAQPLNTPATIDLESTFRVRFEIAETAGVTVNQAYKLQYRYQPDGGSFGAWGDVVVETGAAGNTTTERICLHPSVGLVDGAATTNVLAGSGAAFVAGTGEEGGAGNTNATPAISLTNQHTEVEWAVRVHKWADGRLEQRPNDVFELRMVPTAGGTLTTYPNTPSVTVGASVGVIGGAYVEGPAHVGPFKAANGDLYVVLEYSETDPRVCVAKSVDGGDTWVEATTTGRPTFDDLESVDVRYDTGVLHMVMQGASGDEVRYHQFNTATDAWVVIDQQVDPTGNPLEQNCCLEVRTDGTVVCGYMTVQTQDHAAYKVRSAGGTWGSETIINSGDGTNYHQIVSCRDANDVTHFFYFDDSNGQVRYRTLSAADVLSGEQTLATGLPTGTGDRQPIVPPVAYQDGGDVVVAVAYKNASDVLVERRSVNGGAWSGPSTVSDVAVAKNAGAGNSRQTQAALAVDGANLHAVYADAATLDLWRDEDIGGGWGTDVEVLDDATVHWVRAEAFTHSAGNGGETVVGLFVDNGSGGGAGYGIYREYLIGAAPVTLAAASASGSAAAVSRVNRRRRFAASSSSGSAAAADVTLVPVGYARVTFVQFRVPAAAAGLVPIAAASSSGSAARVSLAATRTVVAAGSSGSAVAAAAGAARAVEAASSSGSAAAAALSQTVPLQTAAASGSAVAAAAGATRPVQTAASSGTAAQAAAAATRLVLAASSSGTATAADATVGRGVQAAASSGSAAAADVTTAAGLAAAASSGTAARVSASVARAVQAASSSGSAAKATLSTDATLNAKASSGTAVAAALSAARPVASTASSGSAAAADITVPLDAFQLNAFQDDAFQTGDLNITTVQAAAASGSAAAAATSVARSLAAAASSGAAVRAVLSTTGEVTLAAKAASGTAAAAAVTVARPLAAAAASGSAASADAAVTRPVQAAAASGTATAARATVARSVQAASSSGTAAAADVAATRTLTAAAASGTATTAQTTVARSITAAAASGTATRAAPNRRRALAAASSSGTAAAADLFVGALTALAATASSGTATRAALQARRATAAAAASATGTAATLRSTRHITAAAASGSAVRAQLRGIPTGVTILDGLITPDRLLGGDLAPDRLLGGDLTRTWVTDDAALTRTWVTDDARLAPDRVHDATIAHTFTVDAVVAPDRITGSVVAPRRVHTAILYAIEGDEGPLMAEPAQLTLTVVAIGPYIRGSIPEALLIRCLGVRGDGTTTYGYPLFNQTPAFTVTGYIGQPGWEADPVTLVKTRVCTIADPATLQTVYPDEPLLINGDDGWVEMAFANQDLDVAPTTTQGPGTYRIGLVADNGVVELATATLWRPDVFDGPQTNALVSA